MVRAIEKFEEASNLFEDAKHFNEAAESAANAGELYFFLSDYQKSISSYEHASSLLKAVRDKQAQMRILTRIGLVNVYLGKSDKAIGICVRAANYFHRTRNPSSTLSQAEAYNCAGEASYLLGNLKESIQYLQRAFSLWGRANDNEGEALAELNLAYAHGDLGNTDQAQSAFFSSLSRFRREGNKRGEALALTGLGTMHSFNGDTQLALDSHTKAMELFKTIGDHAGEAVALNSIGQAYEDMNRLETALDNYSRALTIYEQRSNLAFQSVTNYYIGRTYNRMEKTDEALIFLDRSVTQSKEVGLQRVTAYALSTISSIHSRQGSPNEAITQLQAAIGLYQRIGDRRGRANTLNELGRIQQQHGNAAEALVNSASALSLYRSAADRTGEAESLYLIAAAENDLGYFDKALGHLKESNDTIESVRSQIISPQLRASYFASVHKQSELYISLLMKRYLLGNSLSSVTEAFNASEKAHSRSLLEGLGVGGANIRKGVDPGLLEGERAFQQKLRAKSLYHMRLLTSKSPNANELAQVNKEIRELTTAYDALQTEIKQKSPAYATLIQPQPLTLGEIQASINDNDTLVLEYAIGTEKSILFAVTPNTLSAFELPGRAKLEAQLRRVLDLLTARETIEDTDVRSFNAKAEIADNQYWVESRSLSTTLLGPVAALLGKKRLLIVADGLLHHLPFEALPSPTAQENPKTTPLIVEHEIINLPSASTLAAIRERTRVGGDPTKLIAIIADPVFSATDKRMTNETQSLTSRLLKPINLSTTIFRGLDKKAGFETPSRLPATRREAESIVATAPPDTSILAMGFAANREFVLSGHLAPYRVIHFATHGFVDDENPDLSGVFLSLVTRTGQPDEGFLPLTEIYNLDLEQTQLVVVSACESALGKDVYGEGLVSLGRGFMYAGCKSVVASLWKVDDEATSALMSSFYTGIFQQNLTPAAALRQAKVKMLDHSRFHAPFFWASFVLQGEYREPIAVPKPHTTPVSVWIGAIAAILGALGIFAVYRHRSGTSKN